MYSRLETQRDRYYARIYPLLGVYKVWFRAKGERMKRCTKTMSDLRKKITKDWGKRCKTFNWSCSVCAVHMAVDILEDFYDLPKRKKI